MGSKIPQPSPNSPPPVSSTDIGKVEEGYTGPPPSETAVKRAVPAPPPPPKKK